MTAWSARPHPRWLSVAVACLWISSSGCMGMGADPEGSTDVDDVAAKERIVGIWRIVPPDADLRRFKVIDAAISGRPDRKANLGELSVTETGLFETWSKKKGKELKDMRAQLRFLKGSQFEFTEEQVTVQFGSDRFGPVDYTVVSDSPDKTVVTMDPGLGNGLETHTYSWTDENRGTVQVKSEQSGAFEPLNVMRR
ncbi:MAG: hypothetical protein KTR31_17095 [Myxococcales bacterium]|nr:hypothetical protein [Myxococcales bacterium]